MTLIALGDREGSVALFVYFTGWRNEEGCNPSSGFRQRRKSLPQSSILPHVWHRDAVVSLRVVHALKKLADNREKVIHSHGVPRAAALRVDNPAPSFALSFDIDSALPTLEHFHSPT